MFTVGAGEVTVFAGEHDAIPGVPLFNDSKATLYLASQLWIGKVLRGEERSHCTAEVFECLVGRVFGSASGESSKGLFRRRSCRGVALWRNGSFGRTAGR